MKELAKDSYDLHLLEREILIMKDLSHPGLIALKEVGSAGGARRCGGGAGGRCGADRFGGRLCAGR